MKSWMLMQVGSLKIRLKINQFHICILPHIIWNTAHTSSGSVIWFLWIWFNLSNGRNMMYHMLPLVDYEATSAGFCLFNFPQDNQSWLQMLSSNVLPLAEPGPAIILAELGKEWAQATLEVMSAPFLSRQCFVAPITAITPILPGNDLSIPSCSGAGWPRLPSAAPTLAK